MMGECGGPDTSPEPESLLCCGRIAGALYAKCAISLSTLMPIFLAAELPQEAMSQFV